MATNAHHLNLRAGIALIAAALVVSPACAFGRDATNTQGATPSSVSSSTAAAPGVPTAPTQRLAPGAGAGAPVERDTCPLRLPSPLPTRSRVVPILMYHRINYVTPSTPAITRGLTVSPEAFRHEMVWLKRHGYHTITQRQLFDALMCGSRLPQKPIIVTLDDGYRDAYRYAAPILERLGMRATAYVITGRISGSDPSFLTWTQIRRLERMGVEVASHTVSHVGLTALSDQSALDQLVRSRKVLERKLGHRVPWLAYPFGDYDSRIERLSRKAGYKLAVTTEWGAHQSAARPLALKRLRVLDTTGVSGLAGMLAASS